METHMKAGLALVKKKSSNDPYTPTKKKANKLRMLNVNS
jgi:hypothetical protein